MNLRLFLNESNLLLSDKPNLDLEAIGSSATASLLELSALGAHVRLDAVVRVGVQRTCAVTEVGLGLTSGLGSTEEHGIHALGVLQGKLVEGKALTTSLHDALARGLGELEGAHSHLGYFEETVVIRDTSHNYSYFGLLALHQTS